MQGYEASREGRNTSSRRRSRCSYCNSPEHQVTHCTFLKDDWNQLQVGIIPLASARGRSNFPQYYLSGNNWGDWYKTASKGYEKLLAYEQRQSAKKSGLGNKKKRSTSCGFCGSASHTRRNCEVQKTFLSDIAIANRNYRQHIYDTLVKKDGLSTGAIIKFTVSSGGYYSEETEEITTLATKVNWDSINLLADKEPLEWKQLYSASQSTGIGDQRLKNLQDYLTSSVYVYFVRDGKQYRAPFYGGTAKEIRKDGGYSYNTLRLKTEVEIVSRAPQVLGEEWIAGYQDAFSHLTKKCNWAEIKALKVDEVVQKWKNYTPSE